MRKLIFRLIVMPYLARLKNKGTFFFTYMNTKDGVEVHTNIPFDRKHADVIVQEIALQAKMQLHERGGIYG